MPAELLKPYGLLTHIMSPSARRKALIRALEHQHRRDPGRYDQRSICSCALATAEHIGLFMAWPSAAEKSLGITRTQAERVFGSFPRNGTAQDAADRLKAVHAELAGRGRLYQGAGVVPDGFYTRRGLSEPGERRLAMIDALLREHAARPLAFNQVDPGRCCYAVARRVGLYRVNGNLNMGLEIDDMVDVFGWEPELGTAADAAARLQAAHERLIGVPAAPLAASPRARPASFGAGFLEGCLRFFRRA